MVAGKGAGCQSVCIYHTSLVEEPAITRLTKHPATAAWEILCGLPVASHNVGIPTRYPIVYHKGRNPGTHLVCQKHQGWSEGNQKYLCGVVTVIFIFSVQRVQ